MVRSAGRVATQVESLELFAQSLVTSDAVALEATTGADKIVSLLQADGKKIAYDEIVNVFEAATAPLRFT